MGNTAAQASLVSREGMNNAFLKALKDTGNVTVACMASGYDRSHVYKYRERNPEFAKAWSEALEISIDKLEIVARNRAIEGHAKDVYYKGAVVGKIHEPSDRLMELLLKAHRPDKFNPVQKLEHSGGVSVSVMQFATPGAKSVTLDAQPAGRVAPGSSLSALDSEGGASSSDPTPKLAAAQNDEGQDTGIFIEKFSEQTHTKSKDIDNEP